MGGDGNCKCLPAIIFCYLLFLSRVYSHISVLWALMTFLYADVHLRNCSLTFMRQCEDITTLSLIKSDIDVVVTWLSHIASHQSVYTHLPDVDGHTQLLTS